MTLDDLMVDWDRACEGAFVPWAYSVERMHNRGRMGSSSCVKSWSSRAVVYWSRSFWASGSHVFRYWYSSVLGREFSRHLA